MKIHTELGYKFSQQLEVYFFFQLLQKLINRETLNKISKLISFEHAIN